MDEHIYRALKIVHTKSELAHSFFLILFSCLYLSLYDPFNCISFHKFSQQLSAFSLCSSGLNFCLIGLSNYICLYESLLQP